MLRVHLLCRYMTLRTHTIHFIIRFILYDAAYCVLANVNTVSVSQCDDDPCRSTMHEPLTDAGAVFIRGLQILSCKPPLVGAVYTAGVSSREMLLCVAGSFNLTTVS